MKNLPFVIFFILYPVSQHIVGYILYLKGKRYEEHIEAAATLTNLVIWVSVSIALYE